MIRRLIPGVQIAVALAALAGWLGLGTIAYHLLEGWNLIQSFYFSVVTLLTVGYGDLHPTTDISRLFTSFYILTGVVVVLAAISIIGPQILKRGEDELVRKRQQLKHGRYKPKHTK